MVRAANGGGKEWVITRSTTIWGPGMADHYTGLLRHIAARRYFHVGRKPLRKSYSYIGNLVSQIAALATAPRDAVDHRVFYLADSDPIELRDWANAFAKQLDRTIPTMPLPLARMIAKAGDLLARAGLPAPLTSVRLDNMLTEYLYDTKPIEAIHGPTEISNAEGVRADHRLVSGARPVSAPELNTALIWAVHRTQNWWKHVGDNLGFAQNSVVTDGWDSPDGQMNKDF